MSASQSAIHTNQLALIVRPHAQTVNATYKNLASNYVTLDNRIQHYMQDAQYNRMIMLAQVHWKIRHPSITSWNQIVLGQAVSVPLSKIQIDTTLQREVIVHWLCNILQDWKAVRVMPINVYQDSKQSRPDFYTCWDGQHTALSLWVIATQILKLDPDTCMVPVFIHSSTSKEEMRENFTELNGPAKTPVSKAELFRQQVLGVRVDNNKRPDWLESERQQVILEKYDMFVVDSSSNLAQQPGAITNMSELLVTGNNKQYSMDNLESFCMLMNAAGLNRAVESAEMWQWMDYFRECARNKIKVDGNYIDTLALVIKSCFQTFNSGVIHEKGKHAYMEWFRYARIGANGSGTGAQWSSSNRKDYHLYYLAQVLKKWSQLNVPNVPMPNWQIDPQYLELTYLQAP
jgi:hypothetical protein